MGICSKLAQLLKYKEMPINVRLCIQCKNFELAQGVIIRLCRGDRSQEEVAKKVGITRQKLSRIENGEGADSATIAKIECTLGIERGLLSYLDTEITINI